MKHWVVAIDEGFGFVIRASVELGSFSGSGG